MAEKVVVESQQGENQEQQSGVKVSSQQSFQQNVSYGNREDMKKIIDQEYKYDDEEEGKIVEEKALYPPPKINLNALPLRSYFDKTITPTLLQALKMLAKERPVNPVEFFAYYLITHNPYNQQQQQQQTQNK